MPDPTPKRRTWTPARQHALRVFATAASLDDPVRRSNTTTMLGAWPGDTPLACYWQVYDWLLAEGLAELCTAPDADGQTVGDTWARLTVDGARAVLDKLNIRITDLLGAPK
jgi:hypothetical protein